MNFLFIFPSVTSIISKAQPPWRIASQGGEHIGTYVGVPTDELN